MSASSKTRSQDSFHASSQAATGGAYEDTASSVHAGRQSRGSSATQSQVAPNSAFACDGVHCLEGVPHLRDPAGQCRH